MGTGLEFPKLFFDGLLTMSYHYHLILFLLFAFVFNRDEILKHGVCIRVLGDLTLLPKDVQEVIADVMYISRNNTR